MHTCQRYSTDCRSFIEYINIVGFNTIKFINNNDLFCLVLFSFQKSRAFECSGPPRTMARATGIKSNMLHEYLSFLDCHTLDEFDTLSEYTAICMQDPSCVGARSNPPYAICTRSSVQREGPVQIEDLWLIISDIEEFGK